jgi:hypothetical protein
MRKQLLIAAQPAEIPDEDHRPADQRNDHGTDAQHDVGYRGSD